MNIRACSYDNVVVIAVNRERVGKACGEIGRGTRQDISSYGPPRSSAAWYVGSAWIRLRKSRMFGYFDSSPLRVSTNTGGAPGRKPPPKDAPLPEKVCNGKGKELNLP